MNIDDWKTIKIEGIKPFYKISKKGDIYSYISDKMLKPWINKQTGYKSISLMNNDNKPVKFNIHYFVMIHYNPSPEYEHNPKYIINHKDGNKLNCNYTNLEWVTYKENNIHARNNELIKTGENCNNAKIDNLTVHQICELLEQNIPYKRIMEILKLPNELYYKGLLVRIRLGQEWVNISNKYNIDKTPRLRHFDDDYITKICELLDLHKSIKEIKQIVDPDIDYGKFKKLIWGIRNRKSYKHISDKFNWWK